jgi:predicted amidophosphoribosyltransferase
LRRKSNIKKAFAVRDKSAVKNKVILLVDDIATTGSTIFECARALKDAGAKEIYAIVVARQEIKNNR